jgi:uncharacterized protein YqjF (DUF2071 family)
MPATEQPQSPTPPTIDRLKPAQRPEGKAAGQQRWRSLLFLHWPVPVEAVRAILPPGLEVDTFEGSAFIGLVPFAMLGVRPWWVPPFAAFDFLETNVRTYVYDPKRGEPGVHFCSLEAASWLAVQAAKVGWGLPYYYAKMRTQTRPLDGGGFEADYHSVRADGGGADLAVRYQVGPQPPQPATPGTLDHFFLERYTLFVSRNGKLRRGQVHHTPYPTQAASVLSLDQRLLDAAGFPLAGTPPAYAHYSPGVDVEVFALEPV